MRVVRRALAVLVIEVLVVLAAGLVVNAFEHFYGTWGAVAGDLRRVGSPSPVRGVDGSGVLALGLLLVVGSAILIARRRVTGLGRHRP